MNNPRKNNEVNRNSRLTWQPPNIVKTGARRHARILDGQIGILRRGGYYINPDIPDERPPSAGGAVVKLRALLADEKTLIGLANSLGGLLVFLVYVVLA